MMRWVGINLSTHIGVNNMNRKMSRHNAIAYLKEKKVFGYISMSQCGQTYRKVFGDMGNMTFGSHYRQLREEMFGTSYKPENRGELGREFSIRTLMKYGKQSHYEITGRKWRSE